MEALRYFPRRYVVREEAEAEMGGKGGVQSVDFYLLKKYLYKLKLLKYPKNDYLYLQLDSLYL